MLPGLQRLLIASLNLWYRYGKDEHEHDAIPHPSSNEKVNAKAPGAPYSMKEQWQRVMASKREMTAAKRKRLIKTFGPCPAGHTHDDLERCLDLIYGLYSHIHTATELHQIVVSDPFDRSETPRRLRIVDLAAWLEALIF